MQMREAQMRGKIRFFGGGSEKGDRFRGDRYYSSDLNEEDGLDHLLLSTIFQRSRLGGFEELDG